MTARKPKPVAAGKPAATARAKPAASKPPAAKRASRAASGTSARAASAPFPVVGIGASAGGLAAMPTDQPLGMAFVLVQHLDPDHESLLLARVVRAPRKQRLILLTVTDMEAGD